MGLLPMIFRRFGIGGVVVVGGVFVGLQFCGGGAGRGLLGLAGGDGGASAEGIDDEQKAFVGFVLDDANQVWAQTMTKRSETYRKTRLVLFSGQTSSGCGNANAAIGPFYCPADEQVYIDLSFYQQLRERLGAPGDFAQAYVIAHEVGHHLQHIYKDLGRGRDKGADGGSVRVELQADCYAGIWARSAQARGLLEVGDVQEALTAAQAIGDDALQKAATGTVQPESWSHGSSEQRMRWFQVGMDHGDIDRCNTFEATRL